MTKIHFDGSDAAVSQVRTMCVGMHLRKRSTTAGFVLEAQYEPGDWEELVKPGGVVLVDKYSVTVYYP